MVDITPFVDVVAVKICLDVNICTNDLSFRVGLILFNMESNSPAMWVYAWRKFNAAIVARQVEQDFKNLWFWSWWLLDWSPGGLNSPKWLKCLDSWAANSGFWGSHSRSWLVRSIYGKVWYSWWVDMVTSIVDVTPQRLKWILRDSPVSVCSSIEWWFSVGFSIMLFGHLFNMISLSWSCMGQRREWLIVSICTAWCTTNI